MLPSLLHAPGQETQVFLWCVLITDFPAFRRFFYYAQPDSAIENLLSVVSGNVEASLGRQCQLLPGRGWHMPTVGLHFPCAQHTKAAIQPPPEAQTRLLCT